MADRKPAAEAGAVPDAEQVRAELAAARQEIAGLRAQLRATAALAAGIGFRTAPATAGGSITTVKQLCLINGVGPQHADAITALFG